MLVPEFFRKLDTCYSWTRFGSF